MNEKSEALLKDAIVIDATCPLADEGDEFKRWITGKATVIAPTVAWEQHITPTIENLASWFKRLNENSETLIHVKKVEDIYRAKRENKLGIIFAYQNSISLNDNIDMVELYYQLGVRMIGLCYNTKNSVGDGCAERTDCGLSNFGIKVIKEMNRLGIVVDLSHTGYKTTMEAMEVSSKPVIFSHANVKAIHQSKRNLNDDQIKALAAKGGVVGMVGFPAFVSTNLRPTIDDVLKHVDYISNLVGCDHVSLGLDYTVEQAGIVDDIEAKKMYDRWVREGKYDPNTYPPPPYYYPESIEVPDTLYNLTEALQKRGYSDENVKKILGGNLIRVFREVWAE